MTEPLLPLPDIPDKRYFTIGEVSQLCAVKTHVLRYWEQEFPALKPVKRRGNRRYYQRHEVMLVRQIRDLLYREGFTIPGARAQLQQGSAASGVPAVGAKPVVTMPADAPWATVVDELESIVQLLSHPHVRVLDNP